MNKKHKKYTLFIGRWQPFHLGHKYIIDKALKQGKNVAIAIRDTELSEKNPYTVEQRDEMIKRIYGNKVKIFPIYDIESINIGRKVGYNINRIDVPKEIEQVSGTEIRKTDFSFGVVKEIREYLASISPTFWFIGLPCSGKSTLAEELKEYLSDKNQRVFHIDGDVLRSGLNQDLDFSDKDRKENLRRAAYLAKLFNEMGHSVMCSFITPTNQVRKMIKEIVPNLTFIYVKCSLETCVKRDVKGMYEKAKQGKIKNFTGINAPFEEPESAEVVVVDSENFSIEECLNKIIEQAQQID